MTIQEINDLYLKTYYTKDTTVLPLITAIIIGSKLNVPPVWLYLIGGSSSGKSEIISLFSGVNFVTQVSDLTPNTFLSGFSSSKTEASLLKKLGLNFVIVMKDFTTILSKSPESQEAIVAQMREIYDGHITKFTGTGQVLEWGSKDEAGKGKATFIMASTEAIYAVQEKFAEMGTRATNYVLPLVESIKERKHTTKQSLLGSTKMVKNKNKIQEAISEFVAEKIAALPEFLPELEDGIVDQIVEIAEFTATCRGVVIRNYRGEKSLALTPEMPMRIAKQMQALAQQLNYIYDGKAPEEAMQAVFKTGFDSISKQRRIILNVLCQYDRANIAGIADRINYNPDKTREWVEDLNMFKVTKRVRSGRREYWELRDEYKDIMQKYFKLERIGEVLESEEVTPSGTGNYQDVSYDEQQDIADMDAMF